MLTELDASMNPALSGTSERYAHGTFYSGWAESRRSSILEDDDYHDAIKLENILKPIERQNSGPSKKKLRRLGDDSESGSEAGGSHSPESVRSIGKS